MEIRCRLPSSWCLRRGDRDLTVEFGMQGTVRQLIESLVKRYVPDVACRVFDSRGRLQIMVAVNGEVCDENHVLEDGDQVVIFRPVSGGNGCCQ